MLISNMLKLTPNELTISIKESKLGVLLPNEQRFGILLYADDIVLISSSEYQLNKLCKRVENWLYRYKHLTNRTSNLQWKLKTKSKHQ